MAELPIDALSIYKEQLLHGSKPSNLAYPFLLKASSALVVVELGRQLHAHVSKLGFMCDLFVGNSLVNMYSKCSLIDDAQKMFDEMADRDQVTWNSIIAGYAGRGMTDKAVGMFEEMPENRNVVCWTAIIDGLGREGRISEMLFFFRRMLISTDGPGVNAVTMVSLLAACSAAFFWLAGRWVSTFIDVNSISLNVMVSTALVSMNCHCGALTEARRRFDEAPEKNLATWNAMMSGYVHGGYPESAIQLFSNMKESTSFAPDDITLVNLFSAFACMGALEKGKKAHTELLRRESKVNFILSTALVNMYAKCGDIDLACLVFVKTAHKDLGIWNAILTGLAAHGRAAEAMTVFSLMISAHVVPNGVTFIGILSACSHAGCVEMGRENFTKMIKYYALKPCLEHYACMVDLLGRAGHIVEALSLVEGMDMEPDHVIWVSLLNSCMIHNEIMLARMISNNMLQTKEPNLGCSMILSNIFARNGLWEDVAAVRRQVKESGVVKISGCSWVEVDGAIHKFLVEDTTHHIWPELYVVLDRLMNDLGLQDVEQIELEVLNGSD